MPTTLETIARRRSATHLIHPGPDEPQLRQILDAAHQAPDHGRCQPWSFILVPQANIAAFGDIVAEAYVRRCHQAGTPVDPERLARERAKPSRAPMFLVAACQPRLDLLIPAHEQFASVAAAVQNLLLAATALGFGSKWTTGPSATDPLVKRALGLDEHQSIVGFIHLGTVPDGAPKRPPRRTTPPSMLVRYWVDENRLSEEFPAAE
jgi:nitroreductase